MRVTTARPVPKVVVSRRTAMPCTSAPGRGGNATSWRGNTGTAGGRCALIESTGLAAGVASGVPVEQPASVSVTESDAVSAIRAACVGEVRSAIIVRA